MLRLALYTFAVLLVAGCGTETTDLPTDDAGLPRQDAGTPPDPADGGGDTNGVRRITALKLTPSSLSLKVGAVGGVTAMARFDDGTEADVSGTVQWSAEPTGVVDVSVLSAESNLVKVLALATGTTTLRAQTGNVPSDTCAVTVAVPQVSTVDGGTVTDGGTVLQPDGGVLGPDEVRAIWITRFAWTTAADITGIIDRAASANFNVVYFQIRGNGDAFYASTRVPWAKKLTGTLGADPGWDPLQVAVDAAHARGLQLHAYFNVFSGWTPPAGCASAGTCTCTPTAGAADACALPPASPAGKPNHVLSEHPEWMTVNSAGKSVDEEYYWLSPGNPAVRQHLVDVADELLTNYAVDGLHLDRVRYAGPEYSYDAASNAAYAALPSPKPSRPDWQRQNVSETVGALYQVLKLRRPQAVLSASVWGIYKALPGCSTSQGYVDYFQDSIGWMKTGKIDALTPMIYWDVGTGSCTDFGRHLDVFMAGSAGRQVVAGMYALDNNQPKLDRITARTAYARQVGAGGVSLYASSFLEAKTSGTPTWPSVWPQLSAPSGSFALQAAVPPITWR
ncbi:MAG: hypothetical protein RL653_3413 [Pseudomonadota bacterium]|jgi:uncharacterized lipoprotein YddW (UPF0748 family)